MFAFAFKEMHLKTYTILIDCCESKWNKTQKKVDFKKGSYQNQPLTLLYILSQEKIILKKNLSKHLPKKENVTIKAKQKG